MPFEIKEVLDELNGAIKVRIRLDHPRAPGTAEEKRTAEIEVNYISLNLFFAFCHEEREQNTNKAVRKAVCKALAKAVECVSTDSIFVAVLEHRLRRTEQLLKIKRAVKKQKPARSGGSTVSGTLKAFGAICERMPPRVLPYTRV